MRRLLLIGMGLLLWAQTPRERGVDFYKRREFAAAARELEQHAALHPKDVAARLLLGLSHQQAGDLVRAAAVLAACPPRPDGRYYLARVRYEQGRFSEAEAAIAEAARLGFSASRLAVLTGLIRIEQARLEDALTAFVGAQQGATDAEPWIQAGKAQWKLGRVGEAAGSFEKALERSPDSAEARLHLERVRTLAAVPVVPGDAPPAVRFEEVAAPAGVDFVLRNHASAAKYLPETMAGGLAIFDYDNDGRLDLFFVNGAPLPAMRKQHPRDSHRLYRNLGAMRFADVTAKAGVAGEGFGIGAAVGDYDGDGDTDLFVAGVGRQQLFRNRGDGTFADVTTAAGLRVTGWAVGAAWLDYDADGRLDLFVVNYLDWDARREPFCGDAGKQFRVYCHPKNYAPLANQLFRNRGDGTFADVSAAAGIAAHKGKGMSAAVADFDDDGRPDIFVPNDTLPNFLFHNQGDGTFAEVALEMGVALTADGRPLSGMGSEFRDADNDGRPDIVFTALSGETFPFFRNLGPQPAGHPRFEDATYPSGLGLLTARLAGWGIAVADFNNDGRKDILTANSHVTDNVDAFSQDRYRQQNHLLLGAGGRFVDGGPVGPAAAHRGLAVADLDDDGRLDAVVTVLGGRTEIWRNVTPAAGAWLLVAVDGQGARVQVGDQTAGTGTARGYASSVAAPAHFGLGPAAGPVRVRVRFPGGAAVERTVDANQRVRIGRGN